MACAGLNSLISLSAISLFYIYIRHNANWRYALLLMFAIIPVAVIAATTPSRPPLGFSSNKILPQNVPPLPPFEVAFGYAKREHPLYLCLCLIYYPNCLPDSGASSDNIID